MSRADALHFGKGGETIRKKEIVSSSMGVAGGDKGEDAAILVFISEELRCGLAE